MATSDTTPVLDDEPEPPELAEAVALQEEIEEAEPDVMSLFDSLLRLAMEDGTTDNVAKFVLHHIRRHRDEFPNWLIRLVLDADKHKGKDLTADTLHDLVAEHIRDNDHSKSARQSATDSTLASELASTAAPDQDDQKTDEQGQVATQSRFHNFPKPLLLEKYLQLQADSDVAVRKSMTEKEIADLLFAVDPTTNQKGMKPVEMARRLSQSDLIKKLTADLPDDTTTTDVLSMWASSTKPAKPVEVPVDLPPLEPLSPKDLPLLRPKQKKRATGKKGHVFASTPLKKMTSDFYTRHKHSNTGLSAPSNLTTSQRGMSETSQFVGRVLGLRADMNQGEKFATQGPFTPYNKRSWNAVHPERGDTSLLRDVFHRFGVRPGVRNTGNGFHVPDSSLKSALSALDSSSTNIGAVDTLLSTMYQTRDLSGPAPPLWYGHDKLWKDLTNAPLSFMEFAKSDLLPRVQMSDYANLTRADIKRRAKSTQKQLGANQDESDESFGAIHNKVAHHQKLFHLVDHALDDLKIHATRHFEGKKLTKKSLATRFSRDRYKTPLSRVPAFTPVSFGSSFPSDPEEEKSEVAKATVAGMSGQALPSPRKASRKRARAAAVQARTPVSKRPKAKPAPRAPPPARLQRVPGRPDAQPVAPQGGYGPLRGRGAPAAPVQAPPDQAAIDRAMRHLGRTDVVAQPTTNVWQSTGYTRTIAGDLVPPAMGREHRVMLGPRANRNTHFMRELTADANMGAKKNMFKSHGSSRVVSRSAHSLIRSRGNAIEMIVKRNAAPQELDALVGKLASHRLSTHVTYVFLFHGGRERKLGKLADIDLEKLRTKIAKLLLKHREVGLRLVDDGERGRLHRDKAHGAGNLNFNKQL